MLLQNAAAIQPRPAHVNRSNRGKRTMHTLIRHGLRDGKPWALSHDGREGRRRSGAGVVNLVEPLDPAEAVGRPASGCRREERVCRSRRITPRCRAGSR